MADRSKSKSGSISTTYGSEVPLAKTIDGFVRPYRWFYSSSQIIEQFY